jgi:hypothetical protein
MGVPVNNPESNRENCPKISSACVIWQGPNISCINLCAGDAIDEVVFKLATYLCELSENIFNVDNIDFDCLLGSGDTAPTNLEETIQLMINNYCNVSSATPSLLSSARIVGQTSTGESLLELPTCLQYRDDEGDLVLVLPESEYVVYVATKLCEVIYDINTLKSKVLSIETALVTMQAKLNSMSTFDKDIYVVSQCASDFVPNRQILIQDAFVYFERNYCNLSSALGTASTIYNAINKQIPNLSNLPQLMNADLLMSATPSWTSNVSNLGESLSNIWLTVSDIRSKVIEIANNTFDTPCILLPPENLAIGTIGEYSTQITWNKTSVESVIAPDSYSVQVFALTDTTFSTPLFSQTRSQIDDQTNTMTIASESIDIDVEYIVHVKSIYKCGMSNALSAQTKLRAASVLFYVSPTITNETLAETICTTIEGDTEPYEPETAAVVFTLYSKSTLLPVTNNSGVALNIIARFKIESCEYGDPVYEDVTFTIPNGANASAEYIYINSKLTNCDTGLCGAYTKDLDCGVYISSHFVEFESSKLAVCD